MSRPRARGIAAHATRSLPSGDSTSTCTSSCDAFTLGVVQPWPLRVTVWPGRTLVGWIWKVSLAGRSPANVAASAQAPTPQSEVRLWVEAVGQGAPWPSALSRVLALLAPYRRRAAG